ncbi:MAG: DUF3325 domain-containing protein [Pseudomonadota bacterium]
MIVSLGTLLIAGLLGVGSTTFLALSQDRHWKALAPKGTKPRPVLRRIGWSLAAATLVVCVLRDGGSFAALIWPMVMAAASFTVAMGLAYYPAPLKYLAGKLAPAAAAASTKQAA